MLADMAIGVETARLATYRAAWEVDQVSSILCTACAVMFNPSFFFSKDCQNKELSALINKITSGRVIP